MVGDWIIGLTISEDFIRIFCYSTLYSQILISLSYTPASHSTACKIRCSSHAVYV